MINRTTQTQQNELTRRLPAAERNIRDLKNKQLIGGDTVVVTATNVASAVIGPLAAGDTAWLTITTTPVNQVLTLWDFHFSVFVDGGGPYLATNLLPVGSALSAALVKVIKVQYIPDWASSVDSTGVRKYYVGITNNDSSSHSISFQAVNYAIKTPTS